MKINKGQMEMLNKAAANGGKVYTSGSDLRTVQALQRRGLLKWVRPEAGVWGYYELTEEGSALLAA